MPTLRPQSRDAGAGTPLAAADPARGGLVVVVPVYNEEDGVEEFLRRLAALSDEVALRGVVVVDDGSTDNTVGRIERAAATCSFPIHLLRLSRNFGHQNAIMAGLEAALAWPVAGSAVWIGVIDGDLQDRPEHFKDLLASARDQDIVYAERASRADGLVMRWAAPVFYHILSRSARLKIPPNAGTFSVLRTPIVRLLCESADRDPYFPGLRAWVGFRQRGVGLARDARHSGTSKVGWRGLFALSLRALLTYTDLLFNLVLVAGGAIIVVACVASTVLFFMRLAGLITIPGATTTVMLILLSLGTTVFFLGIIAHMIKRGAESASRQRAFVVMDTRDLG